MLYGGLGVFYEGRLYWYQGAHEFISQNDDVKKILWLMCEKWIRLSSLKVEYVFNFYLMGRPASKKVYIYIFGNNLKTKNDIENIRILPLNL